MRRLALALALALVAATASSSAAFGIRRRAPCDTPAVVIVVPDSRFPIPEHRRRFEPIRPAYGPNPSRRPGAYQRRPVSPSPRIRR